MESNGESAGGTPRWQDLGDSRDLAAAVRSAYQASPPDLAPPSASESPRAAEPQDASRS